MTDPDPRARTHHGQRRGPRPVQVLVAWLGVFAGIGLLAALVGVFPGIHLLVIGSEHFHQMGWGYFMPVAGGAPVLLLVALISNNWHRPASYPQRWD